MSQIVVKADETENQRERENQRGKGRKRKILRVATNNNIKQRRGLRDEIAA